MHSRIYFGKLRHRRHLPKAHQFSYRTFQLYLDIDELDRVFKPFWFWSVNRFNLASFQRKDFIGSAAQSLREAVNLKIQEQFSDVAHGPIRMLTQLRHFGYSFNPVTFYYCFDAHGEKIEYLLAEINNTPWDERHTYVFDNRQGQLESDNGNWFEIFFSKQFHVSPFMPMDMSYHWRFSRPERNLSVWMENLKEGERHFDASLALEAYPINSATLAKALWLFPLMSWKVAAAIYWNALKLWFKRIPFHSHPDNEAVAQNPPAKS